jgi:nucleoside-diphosphate-sugar epimerase
VLVHAAAALPIRAADIRAINVDGTATVLAAAAEAGVRRVVFISSGVVYGLPREPPAREDTPAAPIEPYGVSKVEAENVCRAFGDRGLEVVVLRPQPFVGPGRLGIFGILFHWIREGRRIYTIGSGATRYQLLAVEDLVDAIVLAAEKPVAGEIFNVGAAEFGTVADDLGALIAHAGSRSRLTPVPARLVRGLLRALDLARLSPLSAWHYRSAGRDCFIDVSKAERLLGWRPRSSNRAALAAAYDSYMRERDASAAPGTTHRAPWNEKALALVRRLS